jgi:hypothetical protein
VTEVFCDCSRFLPLNVGTVPKYTPVVLSFRINCLRITLSLNALYNPTYLQGRQMNTFFFYGSTTPRGPRPSHFSRFHNHTL